MAIDKNTAESSVLNRQAPKEGEDAMLLTIHSYMNEKTIQVMKSAMLHCLVMFLLCIAQTAPAEPGESPKKLETENVTIIMVSEALADEKARVALEESRIVMLGFEDVHFGFGRTDLTSHAREILKRNIRLLEENPHIQIRIAGYTSASGTQSLNQALSEQRANSVRDYLINDGLIEPARLSTIGYGEKDPSKNEAAPKEIYSDSAKSNMRVLFEIIVNQGPVQK